MGIIEGDSADYEFLTEAVALSAHVEGLCLEIGLRLGLGTKTIIDAVAEHCPHKVVVAIDPYGSQLYKPREHMPMCRLDYTNSMRNECLGNLYPYSEQKNVHFKFIELSDTDFFEKHADGVIVYDIDRFVVNQYSVVHFDGPHSVADIVKEVDFFFDRTPSGGCWIFDDITEDFYPHQQIIDYIGHEFNILKTGLKKQLWQKK